MADRWLAMHASNGSRYPRASQDSHPLQAEPVEEGRGATPPSVRRSAAMRASGFDYLPEASPGRSERAFRTGNERLYEAYNDLHSLAQDFEKVGRGGESSSQRRWQRRSRVWAARAAAHVRRPPADSWRRQDCVPLGSQPALQALRAPSAAVACSSAQAAVG